MKIQKPLTEELYKEQLEALAQSDKNNRKPEGWKLSPKAVRTFILGSEKPVCGTRISQKFYGDNALVERAIITLAGSRGLMLVGEPGTAKTMLSELLSAAVCGCSSNTVQGSAGITEDNIKYSWNYAMLLAKGPVKEALIPAPLYTGMSKGIITRFEELTRCPLEIQDSLISVMSDKVMNIPELTNDESLLFAGRGFNIIGTANTRDKGVNDMSSALKRRFNFETVQPVKNIGLEAKIITQQCTAMMESAGIPVQVSDDAANILACVFNELRNGVSSVKTSVPKISSVMSTAEAVSVYYQSALDALYYSDGVVTMNKLTQNLLGVVMKENRDDLPKLREYYTGIVKLRAQTQGGLWQELYDSRSCL
ncbi:MAG: AAA family ATPase [Oscillospiraceae bacterium]|nr:AAA family ATPase [Oscillospiraceae bacterium]